MPFGRAKQDENDEPAGRWLVDHVPVMISGKKSLQQKLNEGEAKGYELRSLLMSEKHDRILIVWDRRGSARAAGE